MKDTHPTGRTFTRSAVAPPATLLAGRSAPAQAGPLSATELNMEGPYYRPGAPLRNQLFPDDQLAIYLFVWGQVVSTLGEPLPGALLDIWQADGDGVYDNDSPDYLGRCRLYTDSDGLFWTWLNVWPGRHPEGSAYRPSHIHVKLSAKGYRGLTTQLYFKDDPYNLTDPWYRASLEMDPQWSDRYGAYLCDYRFVLAPA